MRALALAETSTAPAFALYVAYLSLTLDTAANHVGTKILLFFFTLTEEVGKIIEKKNVFPQLGYSISDLIFFPFNLTSLSAHSP
jgi:hypothetical protein